MNRLPDGERTSGLALSLMRAASLRAASLRSALSLLHAASFCSAVREARCPSGHEERRRDFVRVDVLYMLMYITPFFFGSIVQYISILISIHHSIIHQVGTQKEGCEG